VETVAFQSVWLRLLAPLIAFLERQVPPELLATPESARRARLITNFGILGSSFGVVYATFFFLIGHIWGTVIVILCSAGVLATPLLLRWRKSTELAGNFFSATLTLGFFSLCFVEGGVNGHALSWLVSVPLCAMLFINRRSAFWWMLIAFLAAAIIVGFDLAGVRLPVTYNAKWLSTVSAAGYLGLILFLSILGLIFESGRAQAAAKMETALAELASSNERLVHLNNEKNEFLGIAAHDLKNPLTVILGNAELIRMKDVSGITAKHTSGILFAAGRMRDLISTLLDANAIEQGKYISNIERLDLREIVTQCVESNRAAADRKNIQLRVGISETLWVKTDHAATMQIFDNLISNALKFSPPHTTVSIQTLPETGFVMVNIRDEGPGISAEDQKKLFQKFSRLTARPTGGESSNGLGLSIVKRLVEALEGTIQCQSTVGVGTNFMVRLPACAKENSPRIMPPAIRIGNRTVIEESLNLVVRN
jgi:signal transduction histidine kinase